MFCMVFSCFEKIRVLYFWKKMVTYGVSELSNMELQHSIILHLVIPCWFTLFPNLCLMVQLLKSLVVGHTALFSQVTIKKSFCKQYSFIHINCRFLILREYFILRFHRIVSNCKEFRYNSYSSHPSGKWKRDSKILLGVFFAILHGYLFLRFN